MGIFDRFRRDHTEDKGFELYDGGVGSDTVRPYTGHLEGRPDSRWNAPIVATLIEEFPDLSVSYDQWQDRTLLTATDPETIRRMDFGDAPDARHLIFPTNAVSTARVKGRPHSPENQRVIDGLKADGTEVLYSYDPKHDVTVISYRVQPMIDLDTMSATLNGAPDKAVNEAIIKAMAGRGLMPFAEYDAKTDSTYVACMCDPSGEGVEPPLSTLEEHRAYCEELRSALGDTVLGPERAEAVPER